MPQSDSEDFESADEGHSNLVRKERKKRNSSSNYSDNLDSEFETQKPQVLTSSTKSVSFLACSTAIIFIYIFWSSPLQLGTYT